MAGGGALPEYSPTWECGGCGAPCGAGDGVKFWVATPLGRCVLAAHRGHEDAAVAAYREQPARRIARPRTREERAGVARCG